MTSSVIRVVCCECDMKGRTVLERVYYFAGEGGRLLCDEYPNGRICVYRGEIGKERLVCIRLRDGTETHFEGPRGRERPARVFVHGPAEEDM